MFVEQYRIFCKQLLLSMSCIALIGQPTTLIGIAASPASCCVCCLTDTWSAWSGWQSQLHLYHR